MPRPRWLKSKLPGASGNKYGAKAVLLDGYTFQSKREAAVYSETVLRVRAGEITHLQIHPRYDIIVNGVRIGFYKADLQWRELDGRLRVIDVKSPYTAKEKHFRRTKKLVEALYPGVTIEIVF